MEKVFGYVRVSTETQADKGYGIDAQIDAIHSYCRNNNLKCVKVFQDAGISGTIVERDGLSDLFTSFNGINKVIVLNTSRLWRSDTAKVLIKRQFETLKAEVISIEQPNYSIHATDPNDFLINGMMELLDQYERLTINLKLARGRKQKAKAGHKGSGTAPLGYHWDNNAKIQQNEFAPIVKTIFEQFIITGSLSRVKKYCDEKQFKSNRGNPLSPQAIQTILQNSFYTGVVSHGDIKTKGEHEPIISVSMFNKAQKQFNKRARRTKRPI